MKPYLSLLTFELLPFRLSFSYGDSVLCRGYRLSRGKYIIVLTYNI
jgi:hypothetical protein